MSVINTNVKSLVAQNALTKNNRELSEAMQRLSTGSRVNSAKDDAAGLAIGTRMTAQTRGLSMAIRNANDGISLLQTTEGALDEVTGALQRMRELAVQAVNGTNNASDRAALDLEVQQLKAEVDRIAVSTQFNNQALLDGSFKNKTLQIGDKAEQTMAVTIGSARIQDLGLGSSSSGNEAVIGTRSGIDPTVGITAVQAGDIEINGQALGAIAQYDDMGDVIENINSNIDGVTASAFNTVVMQNLGTGVITANQLAIEVLPIGANRTATVSANIAPSSSLEELVANINSAMGGVVQASLNDDGKLVLSNDTGAAIKITDASTLGAGTGHGSTSATTYNGFLKLESSDGAPIRITRGNLGDSAPGTVADLTVLGFNETTTEPTGENYTVTGQALSAPGTAWTATDLTINGVAIYDEDIATTSFAGKLNAINNFTSETGVVATAYYEKSFEGESFVANQQVKLNGVTINTGASLSAFVTAINLQTANTGLVASLNGSNVTLSGANVKSVTVDYIDPAVTAGVLNSSVNAAGTAAVARTIAISTADLAVGRTFELNVRSTSAEKGSFSVYYTVGTGDTAATVAQGLRSAILATRFAASGTVKAATVPGYVNSTANPTPTISAGTSTITLKSTAGAYGSATINLSVVSTEVDDSKVYSTAINEPSTTTATARTVTFVSADFDAGKTYELRLAGGSANDANATVRVTMSDTAASNTKTAIAAAFAAAINASTGAYVGTSNTVSLNTVTAGARASATTGTLTIASGAHYGAANIRLIEVATPLGESATTYGALRLDSNDNTPIRIETGQSASTTTLGLLEQNVGASDFDVNDPSLGTSFGASLTGLSVANASSANSAITSLDSALDQVNSMRATMGAMQNRLDRTVNNLSNVLANTEASRSQIMDTDYAVETTNLAKAQIIQQAATAMLAQANQQPQSVLALLQ